MEIKAEMESIGENGNSGGSGYNGGGESLNGAAGEKVYATASASLKPEITQICWQDGLRYLQLRWFLQ